ncbi:hypothetical protein PP935_gp228 [Rhizobium phage RHph_N34]|uniref:Uncharacterized protein n=1 Tax=Rhizobium phage RHph_N34 TaxID=2509586 RepID=A0A7S5V026_9CAUD|nr:hypothetical protein PP935_gp228 [Rhizobium phage RHph_N34]QIG74003.1 hypothetical protein EVC06_228 [Rhizobium phage RHph_N34]
MKDNTNPFKFWDWNSGPIGGIITGLIVCGIIHLIAIALKFGGI